MIAQDLIARLQTAHNNAVKAAQRLAAATPGTRAKEVALARYENAEARFDSAVVAILKE